MRAAHRPCVCGARRAFSAIAAVRFLAIHPVWLRTHTLLCCSDEKFLADHSCQRAAGSPKSRSPEVAPPVARRSGRNPQSSPAPSADGAIPGQGPWSAPPPLWGGRRGPSTSTAPGTIHPRISANTYHIHGGGKPPPYGVEPISLWKLVCNFRPKTFKNRRRNLRRRFVVPNKITWRKPSSGCRSGAGRPP